MLTALLKARSRLELARPHADARRARGRGRAARSTRSSRCCATRSTRSRSTSRSATTATPSSATSSRTARPSRPFEAAATALLPGEVAKVLTVLDERERTILALRFGLDGGGERTLEEVAEHFGLTRERIRQIEARAMSKLRHPSRRRRRPRAARRLTTEQVPGKPLGPGSRRGLVAFRTRASVAERVSRGAASEFLLLVALARRRNTRRRPTGRSSLLADRRGMRSTVERRARLSG